ncbi:hypothetical protein HHI36_023181 [Cryptolaemus montrouzieri]|uniref:DDE-1 domain-containing protein n=1 Tax=Cryptolaemus montrouzieri TaxID=559131 RepID=A0ABD2PG60_9CUCU
MAEGVSARAEGMSREITMSYFQILYAVLEENGLFGKLGSINNMDETGLLLNNKVGYFIAEKDQRVGLRLHKAKKEKRSWLSLAAEETFLPPACLFKGKYRKDEVQEGVPNGTVVYMNQKSAYVNADIFILWLTEHLYLERAWGKHS